MNLWSHALHLLNWLLLSTQHLDVCFLPPPCCWELEGSLRSKHVSFQFSYSFKCQLTPDYFLLFSEHELLGPSPLRTKDPYVILHPVTTQRASGIILLPALGQYILGMSLIQVMYFKLGGDLHQYSVACWLSKSSLVLQWASFPLICQRGSH